MSVDDENLIGRIRDNTSRGKDIIMALLFLITFNYLLVL